ncbi:MAG: hypothetical protein EOO06_15360 [Chitinophagaceae bacterium]|nr:MAG: hypothetical protein EOO06_15360 [Chitinophagaceae bacterium]
MSRHPYLCAMKPTLSILVLLWGFTCAGQKMLIPYRLGTQFGLADEKGKIIVAPQYDRVSWMEGTWFETSKKIALKDTIETEPGRWLIRNTTAKLTGLINNGKIILKDEPFEDYEIIANKFIVGTYESRLENLTKAQIKKYSSQGKQRKVFSLFSLAGKNLYPDNFRRIQKIDTAGVSEKYKGASRYILFVVQHFNDAYSMFVVDADKQQISEWLLKEVAKIELHRGFAGTKKIAFTVTQNSFEQQHKLLDYSKGSFVVTNVEMKTSTSTKKRGEVEVERVELTTEGAGRYDVTEAPRMEGDVQPARPAPAFNPYFIKTRDSLFYVVSHQDKRAVPQATGSQVILMEPRATTQYQPVILKNEGKFFITRTASPGTIAYDSLIYFGKYFLAWQTINGRSKAGVIDADGNPIIPFEYDSLYADIRFFNLKNTTPARDKANYIIDLPEADSKYRSDKPYPYKRTFSNHITVFKNGKAGLLNMKNEIIIPLEYELIARNNLQHSRPRQDDFLLLKKNGFYGIGNLAYAKGANNPALALVAPPAFEYIPGFYYKDYYGLKDFRLIGLYNEQYEFMGYAGGEGRLYYKR